MQFPILSALLLLVAAFTGAEELSPAVACDPFYGGLIPLSCDTDGATVPQEKQKVKIETDDFKLRAKIKCKGTAAAFACLGPGPTNETIGIMIGSDDGVLDFEPNGDSVCASFFYLGGEAQRFKSTCEGDGFEIEQKLIIKRK